MQIKIKIEGKEKIFSPSFISARMVRKTLEIKERLQTNIGKKDLDSMVEYMVDLFGNQFSIDDFYDGIPVDQFIPISIRCMDDVLAQFTGKVEVAEKN